MAESSKDLSSTVTGVIAILLLAVGVIVQHLFLERPLSSAKPVEIPVGLQTAGLWQDPNLPQILDPLSLARSK